MHQITVIQEKAAEAEAIVRAITSDIQRLDVAKRNLTGAIQTIERWGMLSQSSIFTSTRSSRTKASVHPEQAHRQLKELLPTKRFREISQALAVCTH